MSYFTVMDYSSRQQVFSFLGFLSRQTINSQKHTAGGSGKLDSISFWKKYMKSAESSATPQPNKPHLNPPKFVNPVSASAVNANNEAMKQSDRHFRGTSEND